MGKGAIDELHPLAMGCTWGLSSVPRGEGMHFELLQRSDAALAAGTRFTAMSSGRWALPFPSRLIHLDVDAEEFGRNYRPEIALQADAREGLEALLQAVGGRRAASQWTREQLATLRRAYLDEARARSPLAMGLVDALRATIPADGILSNDQSMLNYWCARFYPARGPRTFLYPIGSATLGFGAPAAYGAKSARSETAVVALAGDGGFLFTVQDLAAAVQAKLAVPVIVINDSAYGIIKSAQRRRYGERPLAVDLHNPDFLHLGQAFGARAARVDSPDALREALSHALEADGPTLIEVPAKLPPPMG
jgi:thiamine pyrophosphate-dependent acetolactate synthase large subunit-like protein